MAAKSQPLCSACLPQARRDGLGSPQVAARPPCGPAAVGLTAGIVSAQQSLFFIETLLVEHERSEPLGIQ